MRKVLPDDRCLLAWYRESRGRRYQKEPAGEQWAEDPAVLHRIAAGDATCDGGDLKLSARLHKQLHTKIDDGDEEDDDEDDEGECEYDGEVSGSVSSSTSSNNGAGTGSERRRRKRRTIASSNDDDNDEDEDEDEGEDDDEDEDVDKDEDFIEKNETNEAREAIKARECELALHEAELGGAVAKATEDKGRAARATKVVETTRAKLATLQKQLDAVNVRLLAEQKAETEAGDRLVVSNQREAKCRMQVEETRRDIRRKTEAMGVTRGQSGATGGAAGGGSGSGNGDDFEGDRDDDDAAAKAAKAAKDAKGGQKTSRRRKRKKGGQKASQMMDSASFGKGSGDEDSDDDAPVDLDAASSGRMGGGSGAKKRKVKRDPNKPKGATSAFLYFSKGARAAVKAASPDMAFGDIAKKVGADWKALGGDAKKPYEAQAEADKARYAKEMESYEAPPVEYEAEKKKTKKKKKKKKGKGPDMPKKRASKPPAAKPDSDDEGSEDGGGAGGGERPKRAKTSAAAADVSLFSEEQRKEMEVLEEGDECGILDQAGDARLTELRALKRVAKAAAPTAAGSGAGGGAGGVASSRNGAVAMDVADNKDADDDDADAEVDGDEGGDR